MLLSMEQFRVFQPEKPTYALFGWPLGHTMSPELHAQLFAASGQDADYIGVAVPPEDLPEAFELAERRLGGINCTIPHKKAVIPLLDEVDTAARNLHSVNTVAFRDGKAVGYNTDILGFAESLTRDGIRLRGKKVLLLGYGGAASVMAYHCVTQGAYLTITGRNLDKAESLRQQLCAAVPGAHIAVYNRRHIPRDIQIVLNSTPVGMYPRENAAPLHYLPHKAEHVVRRDLQPTCNRHHAAGQPQKGPRARRSVHAGHAGGLRADGLVGRAVTSRRPAKPFCAAPMAKWRSSACMKSTASATSCCAASWAAARPPLAGNSPV